MAKSIIVYGVPGGKTRFAQRIADHFGLELAAYEFQREGNNLMWTYSKLYLSSDVGNPGGEYSAHSRSFQSVADEINASIPLTDWQSGPPPMAGEWNASRYEDPENRMWWHGNGWSSSFHNDESESRKNRLAKEANFGGFSCREIRWRGLSQEPIKVTE